MLRWIRKSTGWNLVRCRSYYRRTGEHVEGCPCAPAWTTQTASRPEQRVDLIPQNCTVPGCALPVRGCPAGIQIFLNQYNVHTPRSKVAVCHIHIAVQRELVHRELIDILKKVTP